jgi:hypothetical protein
MLEQLSKKDTLWRQIAFNICKCRDTADELTNTMYLKLYDYGTPVEKLTDGYVGLTLYNLFIDKCKQKKNASIDNFYYLEDKVTDTTFSDEDLEILSKANELSWWKRQLIIESYDKNPRQIEREFNINYNYVYRHTIKARQYILGEDYKPKKKNNGKESA